MHENNLFSCLNLQILYQTKETFIPYLFIIYPFPPLFSQSKMLLNVINQSKILGWQMWRFLIAWKKGIVICLSSVSYIECALSPSHSSFHTLFRISTLLLTLCYSYPFSGFHVGFHFSQFQPILVDCVLQGFFFMLFYPFKIKSCSVTISLLQPIDFFYSLQLIRVLDFLWC